MAESSNPNNRRRQTNNGSKGRGKKKKNSNNTRAPQQANTKKNHREETQPSPPQEHAAANALMNNGKDIPPTISTHDEKNLLKTAEVLQQQPALRSIRTDDNPEDVVTGPPVAVASSSLSTSSIPRIELFYNSSKQLRQRVQLLSSYGYNKFNLVNKENHQLDALLESTQIIREICPLSDICIHYSLKYNNNRSSNDDNNNRRGNITSLPNGKDQQQQQQQHPITILEEFITKRSFGFANEILIVSGGYKPSKPKPKKWNTVVALDKLSTTTTICTTTNTNNSARPNLAVAYNPYLPTNLEEEETKCLQSHLQTGLVSKVYLQFGSDIRKLKHALNMLSSHSVQIAGSLFLPTPQLLQQQKHRPWNGVYLSSTFVNNAEKAKEIVIQMIQLYQQYNVEILWEAPGIRSEEELQFMTELMIQAASGSSGGIEQQPSEQEEQQLMQSVGVSMMAEEEEEKKEEHEQHHHRQCSSNKAEKEDNNKKEEHFDDDEDDDEEQQWEIGSDEDAWDDVSYDDDDDDFHDGFNNDNNKLEHVTKMMPYNDNETATTKSGKLLCRPANSTCLLLFGAHDLRLYDNLAVKEACQKHSRVCPVFLWSPTTIESGGIRAEALEVLIKDAVLNLRRELQHNFDLDLVLRYAPTDVDIRNQLSDLLATTNAVAIYYNRDFTPHGRNVKDQRSKVLKDFPGVEHWGFQSVLLWDIDRVPIVESFPHTYWGTLIPFLKACEYFFGYPRRPIPQKDIVALLKRTRGPTPRWPDSDPNLPIAVVGTKVKYPWQQPIRDCFPDMSHKGAHKLMEEFFVSKSSGFRRYGYERHRADKEQATSRLSVHLRLGTLSPNELYWKHQDHPMEWEEKKVFCRRLAWRDLAYFHLRCFPNYAYMPVRVHYQNMLWVTGKEAERRLEAWKWGKTGYPILDAGMRELWITGYMQQNIRMIAASFLVEHLRVHWVKGCEWFHYTLVDADTAINAMMWQNAGKCGVDQWAFVPSPVSASQDPTGRYTRKWVPELAKLPLELLHRPWETPTVILERYGIFLGKNYPHRIITDLDRERGRAVENVVNARRKAPYFNDENGCDVIMLPNGKSRSVYTTRDYKIVNGRTLPPRKEDPQGPTHKERLKARRPKTPFGASKAGYLESRK